MANYKISVVVPIYNVEDYLEDCVNSIVSQSYDNFEVLLIDDGSTDNSASICDKFEQKYSFVTVYHQVNQGVSVARNTGIELATGKWLTFVDGDDMLCEDALLECSKELKPDIDYYILNSLRENEKGEVFYSYPIDLKLQGKTFKSLDLFSKYGFSHGVVWGAMYNIDFINKYQLRFVKGIINSQDTIFSGFAQHFANKIHFSCIDFCYIKYREGSASRSWEKKRVVKYIGNLSAIEDEANKYNIDYDSSPIIRFLYYIMISNIVKQAVKPNVLSIYSKINDVLKMSSFYPISTKGINISKNKISILNTSVWLFIKLILLKERFCK